MKAVKKTGKKQLIIAGVVTEVCVAFPALEEGYEVFVITDASGAFNDITRHSAWDRTSRSSAQLMTWLGAACELHRDWQNDIAGLGTLFSNHISDYRNLWQNDIAGLGTLFSNHISDYRNLMTSFIAQTEKL